MIKIKMTGMCLMSAMGLSLMAQAHAQNWILTSDSHLGFEIKSVGFLVIRGKFNQFSSKMSFNPKAPENASTELVMDIKSLTLSQPVLKHMIMSEALFNVAQYKTATFKSSQFESLGNYHYRIAGYLTLRGVTQPVVLNTTLTPNATHPTRLDVEAFTVINRSDFGMKKVLAGVGEKVNIQLSGQWKGI